MAATYHVKTKPYNNPIATNQESQPTKNRNQPRIATNRMTTNNMFSQHRLTRTEWNNIEIQVPENEKKILRLIIDGFNNTDIFFNNNSSLISLMKIEPNPEIHQYIFKTYFESTIKHIHEQYTPLTFNKQLSKKDKIRIENTNANITQMKINAFDFFIFDLVIDATNTNGGIASIKAYYTLIQLLKPDSNTTIPHTNPYLLEFVKGYVIPSCSIRVSIRDLFYGSPTIIELNRNLIKYQNITLFEHQRKLYDLLRDATTTTTAKLIFYTAPTGGGKTLTPLGIINDLFRVIFICASRHIGLALAKSAISMEKRIAIAFGCETADDIRLHYFAADVYTKNTKSGGIHKVDNSYGQNVELMICDASSYLVAMHYMLTFNPETRLITFWDEPTISMDCSVEHPLHPILHRNWSENKISRLILSCATLPNQLEIQPTINDFLLKFPGAMVKTISSFDFKKTIRIVNSNGFPVLPHTLFTNYRDIIESVEHCKQNPTLLRYIDLSTIVEFIRDNSTIDILDVLLQNITAENLTMNSIKHLYLRFLLEFIEPEEWKITQHTPLWRCQKNEPNTNLRKINSESGVTTTASSTIVRMNSVPTTVNTVTTYNGCVFLSTADAHTLTDGPTLYLVEDTIKIGRFLFQQSKIPDTIIQNIVKCIETNNQLQTRISELQKKIDDMRAQLQKNDGEVRDTKEIREISEFIDSIQRQIKPIQMASLYVPNTSVHLDNWCTQPQHHTPFTSNIADEFIVRVMQLGDKISDEIKILLMMGIGIFCEDLPIPYHEIIKELAYEQQLYLVIASSDYIYGTNYQFCHGFLGRDLANMTPQKIIQAMGRVGRGNIQQNYTVRFRNDDLLYKLFLPLKDRFNIEADVMNRLFSTGHGGDSTTL